MSENSHIDKIFKDGLGEMNFTNTDALWQQMETELDKDGGNKKRPFVFFIVLASLLIAGFFTVQHFNKPAITAAAKKIIPTQTETGTDNLINDKNASAAKNISLSNNNAVTASAMPVAKQAVTNLHKNKFAVNTSAPEELNTIADEKTNANVTAEQEMPVDDIQLEKIFVQADLIALTDSKFSPSTSIIPVSNAIVATPAAFKKETPKANKISIEAVAGGDLLRLNRKVGFYAGIRLNRHVDKSTVVSVGVNYASHTVLDKYRVASKPAEQRKSDARINSISSVRVHIYLQRQMGSSKFAMMIGLVPTYVTAAEVYNVPDSYIGDPNPYRKFTLEDINRFNLLFGAGIKYTPVNHGPFNRLSFELSGSYGLTGLVKDGYKNLSRVNDNFKSIQLGVALRLK